MGTFYAATATSIEVPLAALLLPGTYTVRLAVADTAQDARVAADVPLIIEGPAETVVPAGVVPELVGVDQGADAASGPPFWIFAAIAFLLVGAFAALIFALARRSRSRLPDDHG
jgi:hypothetical protein